MEKFHVSIPSLYRGASHGSLQSLGVHRSSSFVESSQLQSYARLETRLAVLLHHVGTGEMTIMRTTQTLSCLSREIFWSELSRFFLFLYLKTTQSDENIG